MTARMQNDPGGIGTPAADDELLVFARRLAIAHAVRADTAIAAMQGIDTQRQGPPCEVSRALVAAFIVTRYQQLTLPGSSLAEVARERDNARARH
jgi:hypothetical protein